MGGGSAFRQCAFPIQETDDLVLDALQVLDRLLDVDQLGLEGGPPGPGAALETQRVDVQQTIEDLKGIEDEIVTILKREGALPEG